MKMNATSTHAIPTVFIAIPVFNRLKHTRQCLFSLKQMTYPHYCIVVCDDGSTDGTGAFLRSEYSDVHVLNGDGSLFWTGGTNRCLNYILDMAAPDDLVLTLNNDVTVPEDYLDRLVDAHHSYPDALIGSLAVLKDAPDRIETGESVHNWATAKKGYKNKFGEKIGRKHRGIVPVPKLCGKGVLIPVKVFREIGLYDQKRFPHYGADEDFTLRARKKGFAVLLNYDARVMSDASQTGLGTRNTRPELAQFLKSLFSIRSPNNLVIKLRFARQHCPRHLLPQHLMFDLIRTCGGFVRRYAHYHISNLTRQAPAKPQE